MTRSHLVPAVVGLFGALLALVLFCGAVLADTTAKDVSVKDVSAKDVSAKESANDVSASNAAEERALAWLETARQEIAASRRMLDDGERRRLTMRLRRELHALTRQWPAASEVGRGARQELEALEAHRGVAGTGVLAGGAKAADDVAVDDLGTIQGRVLSLLDSGPIVDAAVSVLRTTGGADSTSTDGNGSFRVDVLPGEYVVIVRADGWEDQAYDTAYCPPAAPCDTEARTLAVTAGESVRVDFRLRPSAALSGQVRSTSGEPIAFPSVEIYDRHGQPVDLAFGDREGLWRVPDLQPSTYFAVASDLGSLAELYEELPCAACDVTTGTPIELAFSQEREDIDFTLASDGRIEGQMVAAADGSPVSGRIGIYDAGGNLVREDLVSSPYSLAVPSGSYRIALFETFSNLLGAVYPGIPCVGGQPSPSCPLEQGELIEVGPGIVVAGIDFSLEVGATIEGRLIDPDDSPTQSGYVLSASTLGGLVQRSFVREGGTYVAGPYDTGDIVLVGVREDPATLEEDFVLWPDEPCEVCLTDDDNLLAVVRGEVRSGIDFHFPEQGSIDVRVVDAASGEPIEDATSHVYTAAGESVFDIDRLAPGDYLLAAEAPGYRSETSGGAALPAGRIVPDDVVALAAPVILAAGDDLAVTIALDRLGVLRGRVVDPQGAPVEGVVVAPVLATGVVSGSVLTDAAGSYELPAPVEDVLLGASSPSRPFVDLLWPDVPCLGVFSAPRTLCRVDEATPLSVALGATRDLPDFVMVPESVLEIEVVDGVTGAPVPSYGVTLYAADGTRIEGMTSVGSFDRLPAGGYRLLGNATGFVTTAYGAAQCGPAGCGPLGGDVIDLAVGETRAVTLPLVRAPLPLDALALRDARFAVSVRWRDFEGGEGVGQAVPLSDESGTFWFFADDNVEMVIKVLDACDGFDRYWVFAAGLTNVEVEIDVVDTLTGVTRSYASALGEPFAPILDVDAFATCPGGVIGVPASSPAVSSPARTKVGEPLVLRDGRFVVETSWADFDGGSGVGTGDALTDESGTFWFFDPANIEVVVKVLDACDAFGRYWVFAAGLTNVEVDLTVTDTETGTSKRYDNPLGTAFQPILDVDAFATCP